MKKVVLIGGSGFVGSAILKELLDRDVEVTTIVRHPDKITVKSPKLTIVKGDVNDEKEVIKLATGADVVISAFNAGWKNPNLAKDTLSTYPKILSAVKESGVPRFVCMGGAGTLFVSPGVRLEDTDKIPEEMKPAIKALGDFYLDTLAKEADLDWIFVCPSAELKPNEKTGTYRIGKDDLLVDESGKSHIAVGDLAEVAVNEALEPKHHKERITVGY